MRAFILLVIVGALTVLHPALMIASALVLLVANRIGRRFKRVQPPRSRPVERVTRSAERLQQRFAQLG